MIGSEKKTSGKAALSGRQATVTGRRCDWPGCQCPGDYHAPRSRQNLNEKLWFCLDHIRAYNAAWDYFSGMSAEQIDRYRRDSVTGHRPTWPLNGTPRDPEDRVREVFEIFANRRPGDGAANGSFEANGTDAGNRAKGPRERQAFSTLGLDETASLTDIKKRYKQLVKRYHPDACGSAKPDEERLKRIIEAYHRLTDDQALKPGNARQ